MLQSTVAEVPESPLPIWTATVCSIAVAVIPCTEEDRDVDTGWSAEASLMTPTSLEPIPMSKSSLAVFVLASAVGAGSFHSLEEEEGLPQAGVLGVDAKWPLVVASPSFVMTSLKRPTGRYQCPDAARSICKCTWLPLGLMSHPELSVNPISPVLQRISALCSAKLFMPSSAGRLELRMTAAL